MGEWWWVTPVVSLIGALLGGVVVAWVNGSVAERRAERALVRDARIALERWWANQSGPTDVQYPGIDPQFMKEVSEQATRDFIMNFFQVNMEARAALGAVRYLEPTIGIVLDSAPDWRLPSDKAADLRNALRGVEKQLWRFWRPVCREADSK